MRRGPAPAGAAHRLLACLACLGALLLAAPAASANATQDELTNWLATNGVAVVLTSDGAPAATAEEITLGRPASTWTWSASYLAGDPAADPVMSTEVWAASITVGAEIMGVILVDMTAASPNPPTVVWSAPFGRALGPEPARLVHDPTLDAWFSLIADTVRPLTPEAHEVLAGPLNVDLAQDFVRQWNGATDVARAAEPAPEPVESNMVLATTLLLAGLLTLVSVVVLVRKGDRRA